MTGLLPAAALGLALVLAGVPATSEPSIEVLLLSKVEPRSLEISGPEGKRLRVDVGEGSNLRVDGSPQDSLILPQAQWQLRVHSGRWRTYEGALRVFGGEGAGLRVIASMPLERYVAAVVASESEPDTPPAALRALAIVVRSWALAEVPPRHGAAAVCDLAHCQLVRGELHPATRSSAQRAARATRGQVLRLADGRIARAPFHAACGGHTADPREVFGGEDDTGARAVADPACRAPWTATLTGAQYRRAASAAFGDLGSSAEPNDVQLEFGAGGFARAAVDRRTGARASGDAFARALDAQTGFRGVRSARMSLQAVEGDEVIVRGAGIGHGVGLCQAGASRMARQGAGHQAIVRKFFPAAAIFQLMY